MQNRVWSVALLALAVLAPKIGLAEIRFYLAYGSQNLVDLARSVSYGTVSDPNAELGSEIPVGVHLKVPAKSFSDPIGLLHKSTSARFAVQLWVELVGNSFGINGWTGGCVFLGLSRSSLNNVSGTFDLATYLKWSDHDAVVPDGIANDMVIDVWTKADRSTGGTVNVNHSTPRFTKRYNSDPNPPEIVGVAQTYQISAPNSATFGTTIGRKFKICAFRLRSNMRPGDVFGDSPLENGLSLDSVPGPFIYHNFFLSNPLAGCNPASHLGAAYVVPRYSVRAVRQIP